MSWARVPDAVADLARHQAGVLTRSQLLGCGVPSSVIGRLKQAWQPIAPGVYLAGIPSGPIPFASQVWAGVLIGGPDARACGATAAVLHGLAVEEDFRPRGSKRPVPVEILTPRQPAPVDGFTFIRERSPSRLPSAGRQEPPRTRIEDTVLDLCARSDSSDEVIAWLSKACQRRLTTAHDLHRRVLARSRLRHRRIILPVLQEVAGGATSLLEHKGLTHVIRRHGLPRPVLQARTRPGNRVDAAFPEFGTLVEFDGLLGHTGDGAFRDMERDNAHAVLGWVTLRFGWHDILGAPCGAAAQIAAVLTARGWQGHLTPCPSCEPAGWS